MKKKEGGNKQEDTQTKLVMASVAPQHASVANSSDVGGYDGNAAGAYHYPIYTSFPQGMGGGSSAPPPPVAGNPPMMPPYASAQLNPHYYATGTVEAQYMTHHQAGYAAPIPAHHYHHHQAAPIPPPYQQHPGAAPPPPQQMYYGAPSHMGHQVVQYPPPLPYQMILPPNAIRARGGRSSGKGNSAPYGSLELNVFDAESESLMSALTFVKRNPKATLFDIDGMIPDIARADEGASRFIQKRLKFGTPEERQLGMAAALSNVEDLWGDHYGNFMLQGIFEFSTPEEKRELMDAVYDQDVLALCLHMHGCRVIQKAIKCLDQEYVCKLIAEFQDKVLTFIHDPNGNHVIQRSIQVMSTFAKIAANNGDPDLATSLSDKMQFIIDDIVANAETLSTHRYGCRVVQRAIEHCVEDQKEAVLERITACHEKLATNQYGNYVIQQVLVCGGEESQDAILETLTRDDEEVSLLSMSKHKYASNVVEAVLVHGKPKHKERLLEAMLKDTRCEGGGYCCVMEMAKDPIANYVVNKAIDVSEKEQQEKFSEVISSGRQELVKSPYAKYVLQKIDKLNKQQQNNQSQQ